MSSLISSPPTSFTTLYQHLLTLPPPLLPPGHSTDPSLTDAISSLYLHPALEAALHILNCDLPSAHFLCRHMQAAPQYEGMYLHGILHRIEGDYDNARAWYGDVAESEVFGKAWEGREAAVGFIGRVQALKEGKGKGEGEREWEDERVELERESVREIRAVVDFCVRKFGTERVRDARAIWKQPESGKVKELSEEMVSGDKGIRKF